MSNDLIPMIEDIVRGHNEMMVAGFRARDNELHRYQMLLRQATARADRYHRALIELEEILEDRYDGPEDTTNSTLLDIVREVLG